MPDVTQQERLEKVRDEIHGLSDLKIKAEGRIQVNIQNLDKNEKEHIALMLDLKEQGEAIALMKVLIEKISEQGLKKLEQLIAYGLKTIFPDKDLYFAVKIDDRGNHKTADFYVGEKLGEKVEWMKIRDSVGGGVVVVVSFILRVYFMQKFKIRPVIFLDEALTQLSEKYIDGLFEFMAYLRDELDYDFLFITHQKVFLPYADKVYRVSGGGVKELNVSTVG